MKRFKRYFLIKRITQIDDLNMKLDEVASNLLEI